MTSIIFVADENFLPYIPCNFAQIARFGRAAEGVVLVLPPTLDNTLRTRIQDAANDFEIRLHVKVAPEWNWQYSGPLIANYWSMAINRLFCAEFLPDLDDVLYLDVDTLIRAPLDELLAWDLHHPIGGVVELVPGGTHLFGTARQPYFNSGVLRMSLERMRREQVGRRARELLARHVLTLPDQDVLNLLFMDRFDCLPLTFNVFDDVARSNRALTALYDPAIVHFVGAAKPWKPGFGSRFAREWRRLYAYAVIPKDSGITPNVGDNEYRHPENALSSSRSDSKFGRLIRTLVPPSVRQEARTAVLGALEGAQDQIEKIHAAVSPESQSAHAPSWGVQLQERAGRADIRPGVAGAVGDPDHRLDLLISLPNSGTRMLGEAIQRSCNGIRFLPDLYRGVTCFSDVRELQRRFPWFQAPDSEFLEGMSREQRFEAQRKFNVALGADLPEFVRSVVANGPDRSLVPLFPDQHHPSVLYELLEVFRPRLLFLRRAIVFSYMPQIQAGDTVSIDDREVSHYAVRCDSWIKGMAELATNLCLETTWLTYDGLFATGEDIPLLQSFYPGSALPVNPESGCLVTKGRSGPSDQSVIAMATALAVLSSDTQARLLRLPGP